MKAGYLPESLLEMSEEGSFVYIAMGSLSVYGTTIRGCGVFVCVAVCGGSGSVFTEHHHSSSSCPSKMYGRVQQVACTFFPSRMMWDDAFLPCDQQGLEFYISLLREKPINQ